MRVQRWFSSLRHNFPLCTLNGDHARTARQHCRETRKKRGLKNFMTYALQVEEGQQCGCNGGFFTQAQFSALQC